MPRVSVVLPLYNGEAFLEETVEAILGQTFRDFEFILVDDASPDRSAEIAIRYAGSDKRVKLISRTENGGISRATNTGLEAASGEYVAMLDQDDVSLPNRLGQQVAFLDGNPDVGVVGTTFKTIDENGEVTGEVKPPYGEGTIRWWLAFSSPFCAPSVMFRRELISDGSLLNPDFDLCQDYEFYSRLASKSGLANLPDVLLHYRRHSAQNTSQRFGRQQELATEVSRREISRFYPEISSVPAEDLLRIRSVFLDGIPEPTLTHLRDAELMGRLVQHFDRELPQEEKDRWSGWHPRIERAFPVIAVEIRGEGEDRHRSRLLEDLDRQTYPSERLTVEGGDRDSWRIAVNERCRVGKDWLKKVAQAIADSDGKTRFKGIVDVEPEGEVPPLRWKLRQWVADRYGGGRFPINEIVPPGSPRDAKVTDGNFRIRCTLRKNHFSWKKLIAAVSRARSQCLPER